MLYPLLWNSLLLAKNHGGFCCLLGVTDFGSCSLLVEQSTPYIEVNLLTLA
jgi:hypothetical protein